MKLNKILEHKINVAEVLSKDKLAKIGNDVVEGYLADLKSREPWEKDLERWTKLALQIVEEKTFPWKNAANVKYPLLSTACMQFNARAYPTLVPSDGSLVKCRIMGADETGEKAQRAWRVSKYMSWQILEDMDNWEEDMDKLLLVLPITGTAFKKIYFDSNTQKNVSKLVFPNDLVVNYWAKSLDTAERLTERFFLSKRKVEERKRNGLYLKDLDLGDPVFVGDASKTVTTQTHVPTQNDETTSYQFLEQYRYIDLDEDGYAEPYIVTVEENSRKVARIVPNFTDESIFVDDKNTVISIEATQYYVKFSFVPNPDGGFYDIGFGRLLGSINSSVDTAINQLLDAGTLFNLQSGFIGKGLKIKMGESSFAPGEWRAVNATGDDIKKQIFPLPTKEPSSVLMNLLTFLVQSGKELASVAEIFVGKMPGQNTPATTTMASIEQGMKVFTAVYKRVYRSLTKEFRMLYTLNKTYSNPEEYVDILDENINQSDFLGKENDIIPAADPQATAAQEKQMKAQFLMQILGLGTLNPVEVTARLLDAYEIPNKEQLTIQQPPQGGPEQAAMQQEMQMKQQESEQKMRLAETQAQHKIQVEEMKARISLVEAEQKMALEKQIKEMDVKYKQLEAIINSQIARSSHEQAMQQQKDKHDMNMITSAEDHAQKVKQTKEKKDK